MNIRFIWIASLLSVLALTLYMPSAYPPGRFVAQLAQEHEASAAFWGEQRALSILSRMLAFQLSTRGAARLPDLQSPPPAPGAVQNAVAQEMTRATAPLFDNEYLRSVDTLIALATYRLSAMIEWLPYLAVFTCVALFDGVIRRAVKSKEFIHHSPELFAVHVITAILVLCATIICLVLPIAMPPLMFAIVPVVVAVLAAGAIANFHRRG